jgi:hypothetical protein
MGGGAILMPFGLEKKRNPLRCAVRNLLKQDCFRLSIESWWPHHPSRLR